MEDKETRNARLNSFVDIAEKLEELTKEWIAGDDSVAEKRREKILKELYVRRFDLDPYIRGRTSFDRDGTVVGDGQVVWHYNHGRVEKFGTSADEWAKELGIEDPPSRPHNESPYDDDDILALDSAEDTMSSTDPSEDDPLDDPLHHHHSAATVTFAKFGDKIANTASKVTPGPSLHEKKRQQRARKHEEHEKRRQKKIALKKAKLEKEREEAEKREMTQQEEEEAIQSSYMRFLGAMGNLTLGVGNKAADYVPSGELTAHPANLAFLNELGMPGIISLKSNPFVPCVCLNAAIGGDYLKSITTTSDNTTTRESEASAKAAA